MNTVRERQQQMYQQDLYRDAYTDSVAPVDPCAAYEQSMQQSMPGYQPMQGYAPYYGMNNAYPSYGAAGYRAPQQPQTYAQMPQQSFMPDYTAQAYAQPWAPVQQQEFMPEGYVQPREQSQVHFAQNAAPAKKHRINTKGKMLIAVYFFIVLVIATLLLVNSATANAQKVMAQDNVPEYNAQAVSYVQDAQGNVQEMDELAPTFDYEYSTQTNWFDRMCDKISDIFG